MTMAVHIVAMEVRMGVCDAILSWSQSVSDPSQDSRQVQPAQNNQHDSHGEFHGQPHPSRNDHAEQNDDRTHQKNREGVSQSPKHSDQSCLSRRPLTADDGAHRDDVVWIGRVAHAQKEA